MKKQRGLLFGGIALLLLFILVSAYTFHRSKSRIEEGFLSSEGNSAENFAVLTAANTRLTDEQVEKLKGYSYAELLASEENNALREMMGNDSFLKKVDYAYIMVHLKNDEVRYSVTENDAERYNAPVGTKLDIMWLLDVNVNEDADSQIAGASDELQRYSYYIEEDARIFGEAPTYIFNSSEWGDHICGYAPLYSTSGKYIGVIGVELQTGDYDAYCGQAVFAMGTLMIVSLALLSLLFLFFYLKYRKAQFDKIYLDPLTKVYNRSFFNNLFMKKLNAHRPGGKLAISIADVDFFKRVNDTFGHDAGDEVLTELGELLVEEFGKERVVRFGGEEFVVGLWVDDESELRERFDALFGKISLKKFSSREIPVTISLGCAYRETDGLNGWLLSGMLRAADCELYTAKESGRNRYLIERFDDKKEYRKSSDGSGSAVKTDK